MLCHGRAALALAPTANGELTVATVRKPSISLMNVAKKSESTAGTILPCVAFRRLGSRSSSWCSRHLKKCGEARASYAGVAFHLGRG